MAAITITQAGLNLLRNGTSNADTPLISIVALGTSSTIPTAADTQLGAEVFRKAVSSWVNGTNPGEVLINLYLAPNDAIGVNIQEVGFFGGINASPATNSGVLLAHGLYSHSKLSTESIQFQLDLSLTA